MTPDEAVTSRRALRARRRPWWRTPQARVGLLVAVIFALLIGYDVASSAGRIHRGVTVGGVAVGGMTRVTAALKLERELPRRAAKPVNLVSDEYSRPVTPKELGLKFDYAALANAAYRHGRSGGVLASAGDRLAGLFSETDIPAVPTTDAKKLTAVLNAVAAKLESKPRDARVDIEGAQPSLVPAEAGVTIDRDRTTEALLGAFASSRRSAVVSLVREQPAVTDDGASAALADAMQILKGPVTIVFESKSWEFPPEKIVEWVAFRRANETTRAGTTGGSDGATAATAGSSTSAAASPTAPASQARVQLEAYINPAALAKTVATTLHAVGRPAKDASFRAAGGEVTIVPSQDGVGPDTEALATNLTQVLRDPERFRSVDLRTHRVAPSITTAKARTMGIKERISRYTTTYSPGNKPRVANIHLLADALDGTLVEPGGTFSFNGAVGERTAAKGYQEAPAIVNGTLVPQLGGGICQVGTTVFNAVFDSGLPVLRRSNHSFYISHYPTGRDATVSWGGPDFKFKNDTTSWVLIVADYSDSSLTIALYGTDPGYDVIAKTGAWENIKPFATETIKDATLPAGARVVEDSGVSGRTITVTRIVTRNGEQIRTDTFKSVYKPKTEVVRLGTRPVTPSKPATSTPKP